MYTPCLSQPDEPDIHVGDTTGEGAGGEAAIAIAEHAFKAGWDAAVDLFGPDGPCLAEQEEAWSNYEPPEPIKALA
jgi:hypothetical protein